VVSCIPAFDALDEAAAAILASLLQRQGLDASVVPAALLFGERITAAEAVDPGLIICSSVEPAAGPQVRRVARAVRRLHPKRAVLMALWNGQESGAETTFPSAHTIREALSAARSMLSPAPSEAAVSTRRG
jgi:enoyl-CoA hydratase/carnithine racemase